MTPPKRKDPDKYWYTISLETLRLWTVLGVLAVVVATGYAGYNFFQRQILARQVEDALIEGASLIQELRGERDLLNFRVEYQTGKESLEKAQEQLISGETEAALRSGERGRTVLRSILNTLRHRAASGEAQFIAVQGGVEFRRGERGEWMQARSRVMLYPGDYVKTTDGGSAEVMTVEGTLFNVRPNTVILVDRRQRRGNAPGERTIALESGWVNLSTSQAASRVKTPDAEARVRRRSQASVSYDQDRGVARYTAIRGDVEVTSSDGKTRRLGERQQIVQQGAQLSEPRALPEAPITVAPSDNLEVFLAEVEELELTWKPVRGAVSYALQVSRNRLFVDNIIDVDGRAKTGARVGLRGEGSFVWRVAANDRDGTRGPWSMARRFRVTDRKGLSEGMPSPAAPTSGGSRAGG